MLRLDLSKEKWELCGYWPYTPFKVSSDEARQELLGVTDPMPARVPGSVHGALLENGYIDDPFFSDNALRCEWVENRWWKYTCCFSLPREWKGKRLRLQLKGVDYKAHLFFQGRYLLCHEGMFTPVTADITELAAFDGENRLEVLLENAPEEMAQIGMTSKTGTQKARFNYKWDFSTRMVHLGIWDEAAIVATGGYRLEYPAVITTKRDAVWNARFEVEVPQAAAGRPRVCVALTDGDRVYRRDMRAVSDGGTAYGADLQVDEPRLWYPHTSGRPVLYPYTIEVYDETGGLSDRLEGRMGFREIAYRQNEQAPADSLPYTLCVNGTPTYINGVNIVPLSLLYGDTTDSEYEELVRLLVWMNVNLVRVWGGGLIEKEIFYDLCDQYGILVWQECIQSSSGLENIPSKNPHFLRLLGDTARHAVKEKRRHPSLAVWSGGNELADAHGVPITYEDETIRLLAQIVGEYDPKTLFLPTSASGPQEFLDVDKPGRNHDVHGPWKRNADHYDVFNRSDSLLHSEFGCDGCSAFSSLARFLEEKDRRVDDVMHNRIWRMHGEWWDTRERVEHDFGPTEDLSLFCRLSQMGQAEALRYAVDANKRRLFRNSGSIVWVFNEPYPNVSNTSILDFYRRPKAAYTALRESYAPQTLSLRYDDCVVQPGEAFEAKIFVTSDAACPVEGSLEAFDSRGRCLQRQTFDAEVRANESRCVGDFRVFGEGIVLIRAVCRFATADGPRHSQREYLVSFCGAGRFTALTNGAAAGLLCEAGEWETTADGLSRLPLTLRNAGEGIAFDCACPYPAHWPVCVCTEDHGHLLPGETRRLSLIVLADEGRERIRKEELVFSCLHARQSR